MSDDGVLHVVAPLSGWCASLDDNPDPVFSGKVLGDGVSIDPTDNVVRAPFDAEVLTLPDSRHAINLRADNGAEFLIHVGIDTVQLGGEGFTAHVSPGDRVSKGQELLSFDMDAVLQAVPSLRTPVILIQDGGFEVSELEHTGTVQAGDTVFTVVPAAATEPAESAVAKGPTEERAATVIVGLAHGIHARPAAMLVESIKNCSATVECRTTDNKVASGRSAVGLMALGVGQGDNLTVTAAGSDADQAIAAFVPLLEPLEAPPEQATEPAQKVTAPPPGTSVRAQAAGAGLGIGTAMQVRAWEQVETEPSRTPEEEQQALDDARSAVRQYLVNLAASQSGPGREIAEAHLALLEDPAITDDAVTRIRQGASAASAWQQSIARMVEALSKLDDKRLRERVDDLEDINQRMQRALAGQSPGESLTLLPDTIVIAHTLLPSQLLEFDHENIAGICTAAGGTTSHVAILAASMDIPMLVAAGDAVLGIEDRSLLVVDSDYGELHVQPDEKQEAAFRGRAVADKAQRERELAAAQEECRSKDGVRIHVCANIASADDAQDAVARGADGCGLLRTEFVFMDRPEPPDLQQQVETYQQISDALGDRLLVVRTLDAGGDKPLAYVEHSFEENPALGVRGIRLSLINKAMLETQLAALLQVRHARPLRVMIPMVTSVHEVLAVREALDRIREKQDRGNAIELGVMVETPAAALIADKLAEIADFFSIGTNDLTQYTLAMDRGESRMADRLDTLHPAVLKLIASTAAAAKAAGRPVAVCGGAAGDLLAAPILVGLGIRELSMVPSLVARQKACLRELSVAECEELAAQALALSSAREVRGMMRDFVTGGA